MKGYRRAVQILFPGCGKGGRTLRRHAPNPRFDLTRFYLFPNSSKGLSGLLAVRAGAGTGAGPRRVGYRQIRRPGHGLRARSHHGPPYPLRPPHLPQHRYHPNIRCLPNLLIENNPVKSLLTKFEYIGSFPLSGGDFPTPTGRSRAGIEYIRHPDFTTFILMAYRDYMSAFPQWKLLSPWQTMYNQYCIKSQSVTWYGHSDIIESNWMMNISSGGRQAIT
ncbi:hypothetical protein J6590_032587 [Homalodisca vitripennis]|nr:hypothetical protein J6590_032587 [Homalodisca vitripennis]